MTHTEQGEYRGKHPESVQIDEKIARAVKQHTEDGRLSCADAGLIVSELDVTMEDVGLAADLLETKIHECQLGLFGYARSQGKHSIIDAPEKVSKELEDAIRNAVKDERLPCSGAWEVATLLGIKRKEVCAASDALGIKTSICQLGVF